MMHIRDNYSLYHLNSFSLSSTAANFLLLDNLNDILPLADYIYARQVPYFILGGGSNLILPEFYSGLVIHNCLTGISLLKVDGDNILVRAMAGEGWDNFVEYTINHGWYGLENLSLIPGTVGASPIQNIGAYGVEVGDFIEYVEIFDFDDKTFKKINRLQAQFSYRNSIFKQQHNYLVVAVVFRLNKIARLNIRYADLAKSLADYDMPTPLILRECVIKIRQTKLPDPKYLANVGSFFHNPILPKERVLLLQQEYPNLPVYTVDDNSTKISAGWLIDNLGLKGYRYKNLGVYDKQALVLVNYGVSTRAEVIAFANDIQNRVLRAYQIELKIEPIVI